MRKYFLLQCASVWVGLFLLVGVVQAQEVQPPEGAPAETPQVTLKVGDAAPNLTPSTWIRGDAVEKFEKGKLYILTFWQPQSPPCQQILPVLGKLQDQYKDIIFIAQDSWDQDLTPISAVIDPMGKRASFRVAADPILETGHGKMAQDWMDAIGENQIPNTFVVDKEGKIAWIGHPVQLESVLKAIAAGTFDPAKEAVLRAARKAIAQAVQAAIQAGNFDGAIQAVDQTIKQNPDLKRELLMVRLNLLLQKMDNPAAFAQVREIATLYKEDANTLNEIAWRLVDPEKPVENPDLKLDEEVAAKANELSKGENTAILDTLARVYYLQGNLDLAIGFQIKSVNHADPGPLKDMVEKTLAQYKAERDAR